MNAAPRAQRSRTDAHAVVVASLLISSVSCGSGSGEAAAGVSNGGAASGRGGSAGISSGGSGALTNGSGGSLSGGVSGAANAGAGTTSSGGAETGGNGASGNSPTGGSASGGRAHGDGGSVSGGDTAKGGDSDARGGSAQGGGASGASGAARSAEAGAAGGGGSGESCAPAPSALIGWAAVSAGTLSKTTGGDGGSKVAVSDLGALQNAVKGSNAQIVEIQGTISGEISIGSNKTLIGCQGATLKGHISIKGSSNVIVRNLKIVGDNCADSPSDCSAGADAITVQSAAHHIWFDHDDVMDGSDGNLDLTHAADYVTISWTKFHYSGKREHQFSNLIGHDDDNSAEDTGHLRVTLHHNWWADNVMERMPRVRFGQVHVFNNLYTASGNNYCVGVGSGANILTENNVFNGVKTPLNTKSYSDAASAIKSLGNSYTGTSGDAPADLRATSVFTPPYAYTLDAVSGLEAAIRSGAGPR